MYLKVGIRLCGACLGCWNLGVEIGLWVVWVRRRKREEGRGEEGRMEEGGRGRGEGTGEGEGVEVFICTETETVER